jgi:hypothetical protein
MILVEWLMRKYRELSAILELDDWQNDVRLNTLNSGWVECDLH